MAWRLTFSRVSGSKEAECGIKQMRAYEKKRNRCCTGPQDTGSHRILFSFFFFFLRSRKAHDDSMKR